MADVLEAITDSTNKFTDERILITGLTSFSLRKDVQELLIESDLTGDMFFNQNMGVVWDAARKLAADSRIITPELLKQSLAKKYHPTVDGTVGHTVRFVEIERGVEIVRDAHKMRELVIALKRSAEVMATAEYYDDALAFLHEQLNHLDAVDVSEHESTAEAALTAMWEQIGAADEERVKPITLGLLAVDEKLNGGMRPGQVLVIGGRPNDGKSVLAMQIAAHAAVDQNLSVAVFSAEMSTNEVIKRMVASNGQVDFGQLVREELDDVNEGLAQAATDRLRNARLSVFDPPAVSLAYVRQQCRAIKRNKGLDVIVVDYIQIMEPESYQDSREQQVAKLSGGLKKLARELGCLVVVAAQLNRGNTFDQDARPTLKELRESDRLGQDPDAVILLHHPKNKEGDIELLYAKNRNGTRGVVTRFNYFKQARIG